MSLKHKLENYILLVRCSEKSIPFKTYHYLSWGEGVQVNNINRSAHGTLHAPKNFSRITLMKVRKSLAKVLVLSKWNYCNVLCSQMPMYLINGLRRIQNTTAAYVFGRYATMCGVFSFHWLSILEEGEFSTTKLIHQS